MKYIRYWVQALIGLLLSIAVMAARGLFAGGNAADRVMIVCDGFTVTALLFLSVGALAWIATTGFFDIFSYAVRKGAHAILPGLVHNSLGGYYEYRLEKEEARKKGNRGEKSTFLVGVGFLLVSIILTVIWYQL